jgi:putative transposase
MWTLPSDDTNYSMRWRLIKNNFTMAFSDQNVKYKNKNKHIIWQKRFWEHQIRNDDDFINHVEYIHYNPVKHKYVHAPSDWSYSSFHRYL